MTELERHMEALVKSFHKSSLTQEEFASKHDISKGKLHYWIKKFSEPVRESVVPEFIPLEISNFSSKISKSIIIRMPDGMEIQIPV